MRSGETTPLPLSCCCGNEDCVHLREWRDAIEKLEKQLVLSAGEPLWFDAYTCATGSQIGFQKSVRLFYIDMKHMLATRRIYLLRQNAKRLHLVTR